MKQIELVFIPAPGSSHVIAAVEMAKLLLQRAEQLSVIVLIMNPFKDTTLESYTQQTSSSYPNLRLQNLTAATGGDQPATSVNLMFNYIEDRVADVREIISNLVNQNPNSQIAGLVLDVFTINLIDVADEFGLPSYVFSTSGAGNLGVSRNLRSHLSIAKQSADTETEFSVPYFSSPVPARVLPGWGREENAVMRNVFKCLARLPEVKGIVVNTFRDLEVKAVDALIVDDSYPKIYPVGPVLSPGRVNDDDVEKWLDDQPENSVVFFCFGTMGTLDEAQVREIALALEHSRIRFLWSLRKLLGLPEGFVERTEGVGKVIGWAEQQAVLAHPAVGGFVSHCGWNSALESVWYGVPIAAFPMFAEQHLNAFLLVTEAGVAEAITFDYHKDFGAKKASQTVGWEVIAAVIGRVMAAEGVREKVKEMKEKARAALVEGGSSYYAQSRFIEDVTKNINA